MLLGRARAAALATCLAAAFAHDTALADAVDDTSRNAARDLAQQGKAAFARGDFEKARNDFRRAYSLVPAPTLAVYEGRALVQMQKLVEAEEAFVRALRTPISDESPDQFRSAVQAADGELVALRPRVPRVTIVAKGPGAEHPELSVLVDGVPLKRALVGIEMPINPGQHEIQAHAPRGAEARQAFAIGEKERKQIEIEVAAGAPEPEEPFTPTKPPVSDTTLSGAEPQRQPYWSNQRILGAAVAGVGVAGLGTGVVTGLMAASKHSDAESLCTGGVCTEGSDGEDALNSFRTLRAVSTIGYVVGALGVAGGAALFFTAPRSSTNTAFIRPYVGANGGGVMGAF